MKLRSARFAVVRRADVDPEQIVHEHNSASGTVSALPPALLGAAFEAVPNGLLVVDACATVVAGNEALLRMFGYRREQIIGQTLELFVPMRLIEAHRDLRDAYIGAPQRRAMGSGRELHARHAT